jgi:hypothetical protein
VLKHPQFSGTWKKPKFSHYNYYLVEVLRHSYGVDKGQHTFTVKVLKSFDSDKFQGDEFRIKGRNLYSNLLAHNPHKVSLEESR